MVWHRWAHQYIGYNQVVYYADFEPNRRSLNFYGVDAPVVHVELTEDPEGDYWGWIDTGSDEVTNVQPDKHRFSIQFTYGFKAEIEAGKGGVVRLTAREITADT